MDLRFASIASISAQPTNKSCQAPKAEIAHNCLIPKSKSQAKIAD
jgi:hypothetical protein